MEGRGNRVVTLGFLLVLVLLGQLMVVIDIVLFQYSYIEAYTNIYFSQGSNDRMIHIFFVILGLGWSIVTDFRRKKKQTDNGISNSIDKKSLK